MSDHGVCITVDLSLKPEQADAVCEQLVAMVQDTRNFPGFRNVEIVRKVNDPATLLFIEHWDSAAAYDKYVAWRTERGEMDAMLDQMTGPPEINVWPVQVVKVDGPSRA